MRTTGLAILLGIGVAIGCGSGRGPAVPDTDDPPRSAASNSTAKSSSESGRTSKQGTSGGTTSATEDNAKPNADTVALGKPQPPIAAGEAFTDPAQLVAGIPADAQPKAGDDGTIDRVAARLWLQSRIVGRKIRWTANAANVAFVDNTWNLTVNIDPGTRQTMYQNSSATTRHIFGGPVTVGGSRWDVRLHRADYGYQIPFQYHGCTPNECRKMLAMKGKSVVFEATIRSFNLYYAADAQERANPSAAWGEKYSAHFLDLTLTHPTLDDWLPASCIPKK